MKAKRTMRDIKSQYPTIIQVSYCDAPDNEAYISAGDFVQLIDLYRYCKRYDIKNDWINPNGKNTEV